MSFKEEYTKATGDVLAELQKTLDLVDKLPEYKEI